MKIARVETFLFDPGTARTCCSAASRPNGGRLGEAYVTSGKDLSIEHVSAGDGKARDRPEPVRHPPQRADHLRGLRDPSRLARSAVGVERARDRDVGHRVEARRPAAVQHAGRSRRATRRVYANGWSNGPNDREPTSTRIEGEGNGFTALNRIRSLAHGAASSIARTKSTSSLCRAMRRHWLLIRILVEVIAGSRRCMRSASAAGRGIRRWLVQEPCLCDNIELVAEVRREVPIPIVTGEAIFLQKVFPPGAGRTRAAEHLNPDICDCGGIGAML